jgi:holliday junction DNA helicase ruvA
MYIQTPVRAGKQKKFFMIEYIKGELTDLSPALAVVEAHGVGYGLNISLNTYSTVQGKKNIKLYVHEAIMTGGRDDNYTLYGFATKQERSLYRLLITVSGVGANTARMILSSLTTAELYNVIANGDDKMLKTVKGIGLKTAQRIIVDLKDKIVQSGIADEVHVNNQSNTSNVNNAVKDEAVGALTMLGFSPAPSAKVVVSILTEQPELPVEQVVKLALKQIK